jgi:hypothetical protein
MIRVGERLETLAQSGSIFTNGLGLLYAWNSLNRQYTSFFPKTIALLDFYSKTEIGDRYFKNTSPSTMLIIIFLSINCNATR